MNISRFTQKSTDAVQECEKVAMEFGNQELTEEHLLMGLLRIDDSLILNLIEKMGINTEHFVNRVNEEIAKKYLPIGTVLISCSSCCVIG